MRILIVDDEAPARARLRRMLALEADLAVTEAADGVEALQRITADRPDALLLDIAMPELTGIALAASLPAPAPLLVFVTAHQDYAMDAFDVAAVDYLHKPYDQARLRRALDRLRARLAPGGAPVASPPPAAPRQLLVSERGATRVVALADIEWLETADNYVALHTAMGAPLLRQTLGALLAQYGADFVRCHRRAAVRADAIARIEPRDKGDCVLLMRSGTRVPCSRQFRSALMQRIGERDPLRPA